MTFKLLGWSTARNPISFGNVYMGTVGNDRFKSYFGSQISSQSLNEIHICRLQPKSTAKGECFHIFLSLIVSSSRRMLPFDV